MKLTISQVLEMLAKANEIDLQPQIEIILDEYWIYFWGYDGSCFKDNKSDIRKTRKTKNKKR